MNKIILIPVFFILISLFQSCKKYEDGPFISLKPKKERVADNWRAKVVIDNGRERTSIYKGWIFTFSKEGNFVFTNNGYVVMSGSWEFDEKKEHILTNYNPVFNNRVIKYYKILRLKEKEMWLLDQAEGIEFHLERI